MAKLSVVMPVYREAAALRQNVHTLRAALDEHKGSFDYEVILVNDGSPDESLEVMEQLRLEAPDSTGVISLVRNFGQVAAIFAGLHRVSGDCVAVISADLQDPPELIPQMFEKWRAGAKTVLAVRGDREDAWTASVPSRIFYGAMRRYALRTLPATGFDFFLLDRSVVEHMLLNPESNGFLQGQILYVSGPAVELPYTRRRRTSGRSGWSLFKKIKYFIDGFIAYTYAPIRLISLLGIALFGAGIAVSILLVLQRIFWGTGSQGWTSIMVAMLLLHGLEMLMIGVIGEYVWRTLDQARKRAPFVIDYEKLPPGKGR
ncbi:MAG: glycosyltransferase family 2 protein [Bryobacteraceae bacterium]